MAMAEVWGYGHCCCLADSSVTSFSLKKPGLRIAARVVPPRQCCFALGTFWCGDTRVDVTGCHAYHTAAYSHVSIRLSKVMPMDGSFYEFLIVTDT